MNAHAAGGLPRAQPRSTGPGSDRGPGAPPLMTLPEARGGPAAGGSTDPNPPAAATTPEGSRQVRTAASS